MREDEVAAGKGGGRRRMRVQNTLRADQIDLSLCSRREVFTCPLYGGRTNYGGFRRSTPEFAESSHEGAEEIPARDGPDRRGRRRLVKVQDDGVDPPRSEPDQGQKPEGAGDASQRKRPPASTVGNQSWQTARLQQLIPASTASLAGEPERRRAVWASKLKGMLAKNKGHNAK